MKFRLLATDPDPLLLGIYRTYFPNFGFAVATAGDGLTCLELLREFAPDALILSLELRWGGGDGVLSIVRDDSRMRPIPVVLTIDGLGSSKAVKHLAPPVVKLLEKPFRLRELRASIDVALQAYAGGRLARLAESPAGGDGGEGSFVVERSPFVPRVHAQETPPP